MKTPAKFLSNSKVIYLDTSSDTTEIGLFSMDGKIVATESFESRSRQTELLLPCLENLFDRTKTSKEEIVGIIFNSCSGSYTGIRIGAAVINSLAFSWDIPVKGIEREINEVTKADLDFSEHFEKIFSPKYANEPIITQSKSRLG